MKAIPHHAWLHRRVSRTQTVTSAFITHLGKFEWKVAPFGLALLPSYYSKAMQETLSGLEDFARNYMGNIIISSFTETEPLDHIRQVFLRFQEHKMKLKLAKCEFLRDKIQFLGHIMDHKGIRTIPEKFPKSSHQLMWMRPKHSWEYSTTTVDSFQHLPTSCTQSKNS